MLWEVTRWVTVACSLTAATVFFAISRWCWHNYRFWPRLADTMKHGQRVDQGLLLALHLEPVLPHPWELFGRWRDPAERVLRRETHGRFVRAHR